MKNISFEQVLQLKQDALSEMCRSYLKHYYKDQVGDDKAFIYAKGSLPVMLVAHLDTVHFSPPTMIVHDPKLNVYWSPQGIGGDDRCGIWAILNIVKDEAEAGRRLPSILFTTDEETGCRGAKSAVLTIKPAPTVKFIIELDRRGEDDAVFYNCGNTQFHEIILGSGFKKAHGSMSDISILSPAWDVASVNLSCGYYEAHTKAEYIQMDQLVAIMKKVKNILHQTKKSTPFFDYQETKPAYTGTSYYSGTGYYTGNKTYGGYDYYGKKQGSYGVGAKDNLPNSRNRRSGTYSPYVPCDNCTLLDCKNCTKYDEPLVS